MSETNSAGFGIGDTEIPPPSIWLDPIVSGSANLLASAIRNPPSDVLDVDMMSECASSEAAVITLSQESSNTRKILRISVLAQKAEIRQAKRKEGLNQESGNALKKCPNPILYTGTTTSSAISAPTQSDMRQRHKWKSTLLLNAKKQVWKYERNMLPAWARHKPQLDQGLTRDTSKKVTQQT